MDTATIALVIVVIVIIILIIVLLTKKKPNNQQLQYALEGFYNTSNSLKQRLSPRIRGTPGTQCYDVPDGNSLSTFASKLQGDITDVVNAYNAVIDSYTKGGGLIPYTPAFDPNLLKQFASFMTACMSWNVTITAPGVTPDSQQPSAKASVSGSVHVTPVTINGKTFNSLDSADGHVFACPEWCMAWNADFPNSDQSKYPNDSMWKADSKTCACGPGYGATIDQTTQAIQCQITDSNKALSNALTAFGSVSNLPMITPKYWGACGSVLGQSC